MGGRRLTLTLLGHSGVIWEGCALSEVVAVVDDPASGVIGSFVREVPPVDTDLQNAAASLPSPYAG